LKGQFLNKLPPELAEILFGENFGDGLLEGIELGNDPIDPGFNLEEQNPEARSMSIQCSLFHSFTFILLSFLSVFGGTGAGGIGNIFNLTSYLAGAPNNTAALTLVPLGSILFSKLG